LVRTVLFITLTKFNSISVEITGNEKGTMYYVDYEEKIVQRYGIELVGWTYEKFVNPSELSTSLPGLQQLLDAINNGSCKFVKLTPLQISERRQALQKKISDGNVPAPKRRKPRKDIGTKRRVEDESGGSDVNIQQPKPKKRRLTAGKKNKAQPKSKEVVEDSDD
jgi:hypothetical protein